MRWALSLVLVLSFGCKKDPPTPEKAKDNPPGPKKLERSEREAKVGSPTHVLLVRHDGEDAKADFAAISLAEPEANPYRYSQPAVPRKNWADHYRVVAAVGRNRAFHAIQDGKSWKLARRDLKARKELSAHPFAGPEISALLGNGGDLIVGAGMSVGRMEVDSGKFHELAKRPDSKWKAYDVLTRHGRVVVAIDDVVTPIWADLLWPEDGDQWKREPWTMPSFINGTYKLAALHLDDPAARTGALYAIGDYGIIARALSRRGASVFTPRWRQRPRGRAPNPRPS